MQDGRLLHQVAVFRAHQQERQQQARPLRHERADGHAIDAQRRIEREQPAGHHVHDIYPQVGDHREHRVLHADEPALEDEQRQRGGRRPDPDEEIVARHALHFRRAVHQQEHRLGEQPLDGQHQQRSHKCRGQALREGPDGSLHVAPPVRLRGDASRAHAQEAHVPVQQVEEHGADRDAADQHSVAQMTGDGRVHDTHQRYRDVGQDARHGEPDHFAVDGIAQGH